MGKNKKEKKKVDFDMKWLFENEIEVWIFNFFLKLKTNVNNSLDFHNVYFLMHIRIMRNECVRKKRGQNSPIVVTTVMQ